MKLLLNADSIPVAQMGPDLLLVDSDVDLLASIRLGVKCGF